MKREIIMTSDGSTSLFVKEMGETFHSKHGAIQESLHVYIKNGLKLIPKEKINVLEFGFGTGLNALLSLDFALNHGKKIYYEAIEAFPLTETEVKSLNYDKFIRTPVLITEMHKIKEHGPVMIHTNFHLLKHYITIEEFTTEKKFDIVYFDVFGYDYQPELWTKEILQKAYNALNNEGIFVTYACKGIVNRILKHLGFKVTKVPGPPGKREMTVAVKIM